MIIIIIFDVLQAHIHVHTEKKLIFIATSVVGVVSVIN